jgi:hypothetical protein
MQHTHTHAHTHVGIKHIKGLFSSWQDGFSHPQKVEPGTLVPIIKKTFLLVIVGLAK